MRILLVHNPKSGDDDHQSDALLNLVQRAGHSVTACSSDSSWQDALDVQPNLVVAAGGDGTVAEVARALAGRGIPVTALPTGTANNIARGLGLTGIPHEALIAGWPGGSRRPFDLGIARGPWGTFAFVESVGLGLLAGMMAEIDTGSAGYVNELDGREERVAAAVDLLAGMSAQAPAINCEIRLEDRIATGSYLLVEILNFGSAGPNLQLAPDAHGSDGRLDLVLVEEQDREWLRDRLEDMRRGSRAPLVLDVRHARELTIGFERSLVHLDDEIWTARGSGWTTAEIEIRPGVLEFLIPELPVR